MSIIDIWRRSPEVLNEKSVKQIIGIAGNGKLTDGGAASTEFRALISEIPTAQLAKYADGCLTESFQDSGLVLQDIINEFGRRLGYRVTDGRYRGKQGEIGMDGLWVLPNGHNIVLEVKTTDAYRIDLNVIADYRKRLMCESKLKEENSSVLIVVGRTDTGDLEAQIRGSRHAWEMRLISIDALIRLMTLKESLEEPDSVRRIHEILIPREFTKLDAIVDLVFSTAEDVKGDELEDDIPPDIDENKHEDFAKFTPVSFNDLCANRVSASLDRPLIKRTRAFFSSPDEEVQVSCTVSKKNGDSKPYYWFAFHPHQKEQLEKSKSGYVAFGCGSADLTFLIPMSEFFVWLDGMNITNKDDRHYWHVKIFEENGGHYLVRRRGQPKISVSRFAISNVAKS